MSSRRETTRYRRVPRVSGAVLPPRRGGRTHPINDRGDGHPGWSGWHISDTVYYKCANAERQIHDDLTHNELALIAEVRRLREPGGDAGAVERAQTGASGSLGALLRPARGTYLKFGRIPFPEIEG